MTRFEVGDAVAIPTHGRGVVVRVGKGEFSGQYLVKTATGTYPASGRDAIPVVRGYA